MVQTLAWAERAFELSLGLESPLVQAQRSSWTPGAETRARKPAKTASLEVVRHMENLLFEAESNMVRCWAGAQCAMSHGCLRWGGPSGQALSSNCWSTAGRAPGGSGCHGPLTGFIIHTFEPFAHSEGGSDAQDDGAAETQAQNPGAYHAGTNDYLPFFFLRAQLPNLIIITGTGFFPRGAISSQVKNA